MSEDPFRKPRDDEDNETTTGPYAWFIQAMTKKRVEGDGYNKRTYTLADDAFHLVVTSITWGLAFSIVLFLASLALMILVWIAGHLF